MRLRIWFLATVLCLPLHAQEQEGIEPVMSAQIPAEDAGADSDCKTWPLACEEPNPPSRGGSSGGIETQEDPSAEIDMRLIQQQLEMMKQVAE